MFVAFFDILGAAAATARVSEEGMRHLEESLSLRGASWTDEVPEEARVVHNLLSAFKFTITLGLEQELDAHKRLEVLHFSDSAFVVCEEVQTLAKAVFIVMMSFYDQGIPVRAGCGRGGYMRLDYSQSAGVGGHFTASNAFAGSSVVNAYRAESCGNKGPRVFLHPSVVPTLLDLDPLVALPLPGEESSEAATHEFNLLLARVRRILPSDPERNLASATNLYDRYSDQLADMREESPRSEHDHYHAAESALTRMMASFLES